MCYKIELTYPQTGEFCGWCVGKAYDHEYIPKYFEDPDAFEYWRVIPGRAVLFTEEELDDQKLKEYLNRVKDRYGYRVVAVEEK